MIFKVKKHLIIPSRWLDVYKEVEKEAAPQFAKELNIPLGLIPKSRWILQGFKDAAALRLNRSVAAAEQHELLYVLQVLVDNGWLGFCGDIAGAFTQANMDLPQNQRLEEVYVSVPQDGELPSFPGCRCRLFLLKTELYGLMTGPLAWKNTLYDYLDSRGFVQHPLGACTLLWYHPTTRKLEGILLLQVDDILGGGDSVEFKAQIAHMKERFKFGKWRQLIEKAEFNGRSIYQVSNNVIEVDMIEYVKQIKPVEVKSNQEITEEVVTRYRGLVGALSWSSRAAVPQGAGDASLLASKVTSLSWDDVREANRSLKKLQETAPVLQVVGFKADKTLLIFVDASLSNHADGRTQMAMVMGWIDQKAFRANGASTFSVQEWYSKKYPRAVSSTLATESVSVSMGLAAGEWLWTWHQMTYDPDYEHVKTSSRALRLQHLEKTEEPYNDNLVVVTDSKSVFDVLKKGHVASIDKRAGLELQVVLDSMRIYGASCRWVPHQKNVADALTKLRAHWQPLLTILSDAFISVVPEDEELQGRKTYREATGKRNPRPSYQRLSFTPKRK